MPGPQCLREDELRAFLLGELPEALGEVVTRHLEACAECEAVARRLDRIADTAIHALRHTLARPPVAPDHDLATTEQLRGHAPTSHTVPDSEAPVFAGYQILARLGEGGTCVVYRARQRRPCREVALKVLLAGRRASPERRARLLAEADAMARLRHPNIVQVYEVGEHDGQPFLVLEYVDGGSLAEKLKGGPLTARQAAGLVEALARGVHCAHEAGVLHRDLKPGNVLLQGPTVAGPTVREGAPARVPPRALPHGRAPDSRPCDLVPKITDFGLAKQEGQGLTVEGAIFGTPPYMAPEQARGETQQVGPATDIYALGAILYECLTGRPPFKAATAMETLRLISEEEPAAPRALQPECPRDLETVCLRALAKVPARRYPTALALADDLRRFLDRKPIHARPAGVVERLARWCRRNPALATTTGLAAAALLAVSAGSAAWAVREHRHAAALGAALDQAQYRLAENHLDHGLSLCDRGEIGVGLLWVARALEQAPPGATALRSTMRTQLAAWGAQVVPLKACFDLPERVRAAALSPDGKTVWAGAQDRLLYRWDVATRRLLEPPIRTEDAINKVIWDPTGRVVLTVGHSGTTQLWDAAAAKPVGRPLVHRACSAAWGPDGRLLVTGSKDGTVRLWDVDGATVRGRGVLKFAGTVFALAVSPDGGTLATSAAKAVRFWEVATLKERGEPLSGPQTPTALAYAPDGKSVLTACDRKTQLWDTTTRRSLGNSVLHLGRVLTVAFRPDGRAYLSGDYDGTVHLWDSATGAAFGQPLRHDADVHSACFSRDGRALLTAASGPTLRVWDVGDSRPQGLTLTHSPGYPVRAVAFSPQGNLVMTAGWDGAVRLWDLALGTPVRELLHSDKQLMTATLSQDGRRVLAQGWANTVWHWDLHAEQPKGIPLRHPNRPNHAAISPDGRTVISGCFDGSVYFWDVATGAARGPFRAHREPVMTVAFSPDGRTACTGSEDGTLLLWDVATARARGQPLLHGGTVWSARFSPEGDAVLTACRDHHARLWDVATGALLGPPMRHGNRVLRAAFTPDGRRILTASADGTARLWDRATRAPIGRPLVHHDRVVAVAISPDGKLAVTGSWDGTARVWDLETGKLRGPPLRHADRVWSVAFHPQGTRVATACVDGTAKVWPVPPPAAETEEEVTLGLEARLGLSLDANDVVRVLGGREWEERRRRLSEANDGSR